MVTATVTVRVKVTVMVFVMVTVRVRAKIWKSCEIMNAAMMQASYLPRSGSRFESKVK